MNRKLAEKIEFLLSKEHGTFFKNTGGKISIALAYPNRYSVGMSNLGFQGIYSILNSISDIVCERVFLPDSDDMDEFERTGTELFSLESKKPLTRFDIIAFSVSFENDYPNILKMLNMSNIPYRSSKRNDSHPLVIMGGVCAFYNPEPLADFIDICFIGEAEEMLLEFLSVYRNSQTRDALLNNAQKIEGIYIPRNYLIEYHENGQIIKRTAKNDSPEIINKRVVSDISKSLLVSSITTSETEFSGMHLIEAMRGCPWSCRFCVAGQIYKPVRKKDKAAIKDEISKALLKTKKIGLIGPSLSDYPHAEEILSIEGVDFSITSLRASPRSGRIVQLLKKHKSISIAPEAGTERLRTIIKKNITDKDIFETARLILESGIENLRLYFMVGLPTETKEDINGIIDIVKKIRENSKKGFITLSISTFVPKPFTPFQWHKMEPLKSVREKLKTLKKGILNLKGVRIFHDMPKYAYMQGVFSMGDRRVADFIEQIAFKNNFSLKQNQADIMYDYYVFRKRQFSEILPWDFINIGITKEKTMEEYKNAVEM